MTKCFILPVLVFIAISSQGPAQPEKRVIKTDSAPQAKGTKKSDQDQQSTEIETIQRILAQAIQIQQTNAQILQAEADQKNEDAQINGKLANYTFGLLIVGAFQLIILAFTVRIAYQQAGITKNSERAWIMAELMWRDRPRFINTSGKGKTYIDLDLICQNDGATPAWISEIRIRFELVETMPPVPIFYPERRGDFIELRPTPVSVKGKHIFKADCHHTKKRESEVTKIIYGFVRYRDAFGSNRETRFGYSFGRDDVLERMDISAYNKHT
jgi:hypothetical protein